MFTSSRAALVCCSVFAASLGITAAAQQVAGGGERGSMPDAQKSGPPIPHLSKKGDPAVARKREEAFRQGGLEAAAKITGSAIRTIPAGVDGGPASLRELLAASDLVVVGWPESNTSRLTTDGRDINLVYNVRVTSLLKGAPLRSDSVKVVIRGGRVSFPDGSWAQVNTPGFVWPTGKAEYMWFLRRPHSGLVAQLPASADRATTFVPAHGPIGVYLLSDSFVRPSGGRGNSLAMSIMQARVTKAQFLEAVAGALR